MLRNSAFISSNDKSAFGGSMILNEFNQFSLSFLALSISRVFLNTASMNYQLNSNSFKKARKKQKRIINSTTYIVTISNDIR